MFLANFLLVPISIFFLLFPSLYWVSSHLNTGNVNCVQYRCSDNFRQLLWTSQKWQCRQQTIWFFNEVLYLLCYWSITRRVGILRLTLLGCHTRFFQEVVKCRHTVHVDIFQRDSPETTLALCLLIHSRVVSATRPSGLLGQMLLRSPKRCIQLAYHHLTICEASLIVK